MHDHLKSKNEKCQMENGSGAPGTTRTCDPLIRSQVLYPAELRVQTLFERVELNIRAGLMSVKRGIVEQCRDSATRNFVAQDPCSIHFSLLFPLLSASLISNS